MKNLSFKPLIKHVGGKRREIKYFKKYFPKNIETFIEPFVGGGAVYFDLNHNKNIINDFDFFVSYLYKLIKEQNSKFFYYLNEILLLQNIGLKYIDNYNITEEKVYINIIEEFKNISNVFKNNESLLFIEKYMIKQKEYIINNKDKLKYSNNLYIIKGYFEGLYYYFRNIYNNILKQDKKLNNVEYNIAIYVYIKEYGYSGLVRYNKNGEFNVPFAGFGYIKKSLQTKINLFKNKEYLLLLNNTIIENLDFKDLFKKYNYFTNNDFLFLDPPYDTVFKNYISNNKFEKEEHILLLKELQKINAKWLMVINNNDFIFNLYKDTFNIKEIYNLKYNINIKNRQNNLTQHLIITNY